MSHDHDHAHDDDLEIPAPGLQRPRRLRRSGPMRDVAAETRLQAEDEVVLLTHRDRLAELKEQLAAAS